MESLLEQIKNALLLGESVEVCTVLESSGSAPRKPGAKMAVFTDGSSAGTVGGGEVEYLSSQLAWNALKNKESFLQNFSLTNEAAGGIGMACGGDVTIGFQFLDAGDPETINWVQNALDSYRKHLPSWFITYIRKDGTVFDTRVFVQTHEPGRGFPDYDLIEPFLRSQPVLIKGEPALFIEPVNRSESVILFGGGHVAQQVAPLLTNIGFHVTVYEDRPEFANEVVFPTAGRLIVGDFDHISDNLTVRSDDYAVIMTRGHIYDYIVLEQILGTVEKYIGCIGSRKKNAFINQKLLDAGFSEEQIKKIHAPIGLNIHAQTPAEIAISIVGEIIQEKYS